MPPLVPPRGQSEFAKGMDAGQLFERIQWMRAIQALVRHRGPVTKQGLQQLCDEMADDEPMPTLRARFRGEGYRSLAQPTADPGAGVSRSRTGRGRAA